MPLIDNFAENIDNKIPYDFIKTLYLNERLESWVSTMKSVGMNNNVFLDKFDKALHDEINDLYMRLRLFGFDSETAFFVVGHYWEKIFRWRNEVFEFLVR